MAAPVPLLATAGDDTASYQARKGGRFYWNQLTVLLPRAELELGVPSPSKKTNVDHFFVKMGGRITFPAAGAYTFSVQGAVDDGVELVLNGRSVLHSAALKETIITAGQAVIVGRGNSMAFRLGCRHRTGKGTLRLLWDAPGVARQPVPTGALRDAWGRFISNEGKPSDWWLQLTRMGKEMIAGKRKPTDPVPEPGSRADGGARDMRPPSESRNFQKRLRSMKSNALHALPEFPITWACRHHAGIDPDPTGKIV